MGSRNFRPPRSVSMPRRLRSSLSQLESGDHGAWLCGATLRGALPMVCNAGCVSTCCCHVPDLGIALQSLGSISHGASSN